MAPVVLRIKLRYDDVEAMIARFAVNVGKTGLFLPTKSIQPVGTELKFELRIATDQPVLIGLGRVKASRAPDPDDPGVAYGMAVELMRVTRESRELILKMLERRKQLGLPEIGLPMPADIDAARRAEVMESGVKDATSGAIPQMVTPVLESAPVLTAPRRTTGPIALQKVATIEPLAPEAPRKKRVPVADLIASASGPIAAPAAIDGLDDNVDVASVLARARMLAAGTDLDGELEALRDAAAAPLVEIGIEAASAELARQLGGSAVSKSARWAPPPQIAEPVAPEPAATEIDAREVEAKDERESNANDEPLAAKDGRGSNANDEPLVEAKESRSNEANVESRVEANDKPIADPKAERGSNASDAPRVEAKLEPVVEATPEAKAEPVVEAKPVVEPKRRRFGAKFDRRIEPIVEPKPAPVEAAPEPVTPEPVAEMLAPDLEPPATDDAATPVNAAPAPVVSDEEDEPALFADRQPAFVQDAVIKTDPATPMIHDGADPSEFEEAHEVEPEQIADEMHRLSDSDIEEVENTQIGQMPVEENAFEHHAYATVPSDNAAIADRLDQELDEAEREDMGFDGTMQGYTDEPSPFDPSLEAALVAAASAEAVGDPDEIEEIEDFEIIAEADAEDADLMTAAAEHDMHARPTTPPPAIEDAPSRPSFLNRLSLDDESGYHVPAPAGFDDEFSHEPGPVDPRVLSAGYALSAFDDTSTPDPDQGGYEEFDAPHNNYAGGIQMYVPQDAFDQSDVIAVPPERSARSPAQRKQDDEDFPDLESALEALDVDLDDIGDPSKSSGMPRAVTGGQRRRSASMVSSPTEDARVANVRSKPMQTTGRVHKRATTEDGIVIDFDDDDD